MERRRAASSLAGPALRSGSRAIQTFLASLTYPCLLAMFGRFSSRSCHEQNQAGLPPQSGRRPAPGRGDGAHLRGRPHDPAAHPPPRPIAACGQRHHAGRDGGSRLDRAAGPRAVAAAAMAAQRHHAQPDRNAHGLYRRRRLPVAAATAGAGGDFRPAAGADPGALGRAGRLRRKRPRRHRRAADADRTRPAAGTPVGGADAA